MPVQKLDAGFVQRATCPPGKKKIEYRDLIITGFTLECRASGGKTYYLRYFDRHGRQRQFKIGGVNDIKFDRARKRAQELRSDAVLGGDPLAKKQEQRAIPTFSDVAAQHIEYAKTYQKSWWSTAGLLNNHIIPRWGRSRLNEIKTPDVAKWLGDKAQEGLKPATLEKLRVTMHRTFELARQWNLAGSELNPVRGVPRPRYDNARHRYLSAEEVQRLQRACEASTNPQLKHIVGLLLLTGARKSELLNARWEHVNLDRRQIFLPKTKSGKGRHVPLSKAALSIIDHLPRFGGCPFLLPNPETLLPYVSVKKAWATARDSAGLVDVCIHDLRHSCASSMINAGISIYTVARVLGHASHASTTARYSHLSPDTLIDAVEAGANNLNIHEKSFLRVV